MKETLFRFLNKGYHFSMFVTKRRYFDFVTLFCLYQVCLKCRKLIYESFSANETSSAKSKKGPCSINELLHWFAKNEKGTLFYQLTLVRTRRKRVPFFLSILLPLKKIGKGVKFQGITPIRATLQTHLPMTLIMAILLVD